MKNLFFIITVSGLMMSCKDSSTSSNEAAKRILDSVNAINNLQRVVDSMRQLVNTQPIPVQDLAVPIAVEQPQPIKGKMIGTKKNDPKANIVNSNSPNNTNNNTPVTNVEAPVLNSGGHSGSPEHPSSTNNEAEPVKKTSNTTKGALIGAGAGAVTGAAAGAIINKNDPGKGAVIGGLIGGAVGSGVGLGAGMAKDKKNNNNTATPTPTKN